MVALLVAGAAAGWLLAAVFLNTGLRLVAEGDRARRALVNLCAVPEGEPSYFVQVERFALADVLQWVHDVEPDDESMRRWDDVRADVAYLEERLRSTPEVTR